MFSANRKNLLRQTDEICELIICLPKPETHSGQRYGAPYLTVMDWGHYERDYAVGHSDRAPHLDDDAWKGMIDNISAIAALARNKYGVRATIHPHAGGNIEFADELQRVVVMARPLRKWRLIPAPEVEWIMERDAK